MQPFGSVPVLDLDDDPDVRSYAGLVDMATACADDVVLWDDDAALACTARAMLVGRVLDRRREAA